MDNFIVSARKYRPVTFDTVVGQQSITNTLKNAILNNQLAQAFLFCGPRGVGKTTCARILAKTINCEHPTSNLEPCNACTSCLTFNDSSSFNIHELDAASNNSVDDIRNLVEQVRIPPQMGKYKVYIIDEVHMLSSSAFNAFLKTLEEPPAYAKFILATTEKHKIIPTILSRCQIFDFKRITIQDIAAHLAYVADKEGVMADKEALHIIAQKADGALRDALSIFDQMVNLGNRNITRELVLENLNLLDYDYYFRITDCMVAGNIRDTLLILNEIIDKGFDGQHFITGLGEHFRNLLMCIDPATVKLIEASDAVRAKYLKQAKSAPLLFLINALDLNNKCDTTYRSASHKRLSLEISLIQICQAGNPVQATVTPTQPVQAAPAATVPASKPEPVVMAPQPSTVQATTAPAATPETKPVGIPAPEPAGKTPVPTEPAKEEQPKPAPESNGPLSTEPATRYPSTSMHSIKDLMSQGARVTPKVSESGPVVLREEPFTAEQLQSAFLAFGETVKEDSAMLFTALTAHQPELQDNSTIVIKLDNAILQKEINDSWNELLSFLKDELKNDLIRMETVVSNQPVENKRFMSDKDKLEAMKLKNPEIATLTDQLNLELDV